LEWTEWQSEVEGHERRANMEQKNTTCTIHMSNEWISSFH
jgi:hypothetical protein